MEWKPIEIAGRPHVGAPDRATGRVPLVFPLSADPPREWVEYFERAFASRIESRRGQRLDVPRPKVHVDGIRVLSRVSEEDVASWSKAVKQHVNDANAWFTTNVVTEQEREEAAAREAEQGDERTMDEMRRFVDSAWRDED